MRVTLVLSILSLAAAAAADPPAHHEIKVHEDIQPVVIQPDHERENAAAGDLMRSIMSGKARNVAARFATPLDYADVGFPRDAVCAQKFHDHGYLKKKADVASLAACLATAQDAFAAGTLRVQLDAASGRISRIGSRPTPSARTLRSTRKARTMGSSAAWRAVSTTGSSGRHRRRPSRRDRGARRAQREPHLGADDDRA